MANTKTSRKETDRWTGAAIGSVSKNTPAQQRAIDEANAALKKNKTAKKPTTKKK